MAVVSTEDQEQLLCMIGVVFVDVVLSPVGHLQHTVCIQLTVRVSVLVCVMVGGIGVHASLHVVYLYCTLYPLRCPRTNL